MALATKPLIVDADAHVNPSHDMWVDYLPANLREHAPRSSMAKTAITSSSKASAASST